MRKDRLKEIGCYVAFTVIFRTKGKYLNYFADMLNRFHFVNISVCLDVFCKSF